MQNLPKSNQTQGQAPSSIASTSSITTSSTTTVSSQTPSILSVTNSMQTPGSISTPSTSTAPSLQPQNVQLFDLPIYNPDEQSASSNTASGSGDIGFDQMVESLFEQLEPTTSSAQPSRLASSTAIQIRLDPRRAPRPTNARVSIFAPYNSHAPYKVPQKLKSIAARPNIAYMGNAFYSRLEADRRTQTTTVRAQMQPVFTIDSPLPIFTPVPNTASPSDLQLSFDADLLRVFCENASITRATLLTQEGNFLLDHASAFLGKTQYAARSANFPQGRIQLIFDLPSTFYPFVGRLPSLYLIVTVQYIDPITGQTFLYDVHFNNR